MLEIIKTILRGAFYLGLISLIVFIISYIPVNFLMIFYWSMLGIVFLILCFGIGIITEPPKDNRRPPK